MNISKSMSDFEYIEEYINSHNFTCSFFSDLSIVENDSYYIIGRTKLDVYIQVPKIAADIIVQFKNGKKLEEVESDISKEYEEVDLKDFIINLTQLNFIERIDDIYIESNQKYRNKGITFKNIRQESLKWIFTKGFIFSIAIVIFLGFYSLYHISIKNGFPNYKDVFFTSNLLIVIIAVYIIDILLCMTHEFAHFISIRGLSGNMGYISIGRRLIYLVFQTNMENIWSMSKEQRIVICFSGILSDIILISIFSIFATLLINYSIIYMILRLSILLLFIGILFEFKFYMKTDLYYVIAELVNYPNLYEEAVDYQKNIWKKVRNTDTIDKKVKIYSVFMLLGSLVDIFLSLYIAIPSIIKSFDILREFYYAKNHIGLFTNIFSLLLLLTQIVITCIIFIKEKRQNRLNTK